MGEGPGARFPDGLPRVAILMSTYNGAAFLEAQLASLAAQEGVDCRLFVRDDGSTDDTLSILARHADRWPNLAAPLAGPNLGPAMSFLSLLASVPADFDCYAFCDQDDVWLPGKLARAAERLAALTPARPALYCSRVTCVAEDLTPLGSLFGDGDGRFEHLLFENIASGITVVMNRAAREAVVSRLPAAGVIMHDWWCALVVSALGEVIHDLAPGALYRQHGANVVGARSNPLAEIALRLRAFFRDPKAFYPVHAQAAEFLRRFEGLLAPRQAGFLRTFVASKASAGARLRYALSGRVVRSKWLDAIVARGLMMAGWY
jgi:glycosyltransferase involved in cell wall biosynthesis